MNDLILKTSWEDVTIGEFQDLMKAINIFKGLDSVNGDIEIDFQVKLLEILSNKNADFFYSGHFHGSEWNSSVQSVLSLLKDPPKRSEVKTTYEVAGFKFNISKTISKLSQATIKELKAIQYIDLLYIHSQKKNVNNIKECELLHKELSILMIPEGKEYGEKGFDIEWSQEHLRNNLNICDALSVSNYFLKLFQTLTTTIERSLEQTLKHQIRKIKDPEKRACLMEQMKNLDNFRYQMGSRSGGAGSII